MFLPSSRRYLRKAVYPYLCFLTVRAANTQTYPQLFEIIPCFSLFFNRGRQIFSLCHFHPYLLRHLDQSKPVKNPINIRNPTDISKILWSGYHRFLFSKALHTELQVRLLLFSRRLTQSSFVYFPSAPIPEAQGHSFVPDLTRFFPSCTISVKFSQPQPCIFSYRMQFRRSKYHPGHRFSDTPYICGL